MKKFSTILATGIIALLVGASGMFLYQRHAWTTKYNAQTARLEQQILDAQKADQVTAGLLSMPWFYQITVDQTKDWQTYSKPDLGFTFKYPETWKLFNDNNQDVLAVDYFTQLLPTRYYATWEARTTPKDSTPPIFQILCSYDSQTPQQFVQSVVNDGNAKDVQPYINEDTGVTGMYYVRTILFDAPNWVTAKNGVLCELSGPTPDESPLTKEEDAEGLAILNSFTWSAVAK